MKGLLAVLFLLSIGPLAADTAMTPDKALSLLLEGNERYVEERLLHPNRSEERRTCTAEAQAPFAIVLGCSDSRVSPEIIFDQGIGDIFIVRVAGNVLGPVELDSIEYSALYLGSSLIIVLGHENCGAIKAVLAGKTKDIEAVAALIEPVLKKIKKPTLEGAIKSNVEAVASQLRKSSVIAKLLEEKKLSIVPAYYDFLSGKVTVLQKA